MIALRQQIEIDGHLAALTPAAMPLEAAESFILPIVCRLGLLNPAASPAAAAAAFLDGDILPIVETFNLSRTLARRMRSAVEDGVLPSLVLDTVLTELGATPALWSIV